jgi:hypothetical protein
MKLSFLDVNLDVLYYARGGGCFKPAWIGLAGSIALSGVTPGDREKLDIASRERRLR